ncbi:MAG: flavodoxin domain-containing protein [Armatimonadota bacterium]
MVRILVLYDTKSGNTKLMAEAVAEGARSQSGVEVTLRRVDEAKPSDLVEHDGIAVGSPTWCGGLSWKLKKFFDESTSVWGKVEDKVGCAFSTSGGLGGGSEMTCLSIVTALLNYGMLVFGVTDYAAPGITAHYGAVAIQKPTEDELASCRVLGEKLVTHVKRMKK